MKEQTELKKKQDGAILFPEKYRSILINGADQLAFGLSHFITKSRDERDRSLKISLTGLIEHKEPASLFHFTTTKNTRRELTTLGRLHKGLLLI